MRTIELQAAKIAPRYASRVIVLNDAHEILLMEYCHHYKGFDKKASYLTTPGGRVDPGESFLECAQRELSEETGLDVPINPRILAKRYAPLFLANGEVVLASEHYYFVHTHSCELSNANFTEHEKMAVKQYRWCKHDELSNIKGLWPSTLNEIVDHISSSPDSPPLEYKSTTEILGDVKVQVEY